MLPNFIGIGAPKAGTTWLAKCLESHPEVFLSPVKETMFFCCYDKQQYEKAQNIQNYEPFFEGADGFAAVGEITATYFQLDFVPGLIAKQLPQIKLFVSLRHPVEQMYSHYWHLLRQNFHKEDRNNWSFEEAIARYPEKLFDPARYGTHLENWFDCFDRSQIHVIFYEDICKAPLQTLQELYAFLEVDANFIPAFLERKDESVRKGVSPKSAAMGKLYANVYSGLVRYAYNPIKNALGEKRAAQLKELLQVRRRLQSLFYKEGYPKMSDATRQKLSQQFVPEIQKLSALTGRDLSHWQ